MRSHLSQKSAVLTAQPVQKSARSFRGASWPQTVMPEEEEEVPRHQIFCTVYFEAHGPLSISRRPICRIVDRPSCRENQTIWVEHISSSSSDCARPRNTHGEPPHDLTSSASTRDGSVGKSHAPVQQLLRKHASRRNSLTQSLQPMPARVARPQRSIPQSSKRSIIHSTRYRTRKPQHRPREPRSSMDSDASYHSTLDGRRCSGETGCCDGLDAV